MTYVKRGWRENEQDEVGGNELAEGWSRQEVEEMRVKQSEKAGRQSEGQTVELKEGQAV